MTKELPVGTGMLFAIVVDVTPVTTSTVIFTLLPVRFENVPPIKILLVEDGDAYEVVGPRNLTL
jgi:hypothetical protein